MTLSYYFLFIPWQYCNFRLLSCYPHEYQVEIIWMRVSPLTFAFFFFSFFFFPVLFHCSLNMNSAFRLMNNNMFCLCTRITLYMRHYALFIYCSRNPQFEKNIKNESHGTIYTFKIYFTTVFSVFSKNNLLLFVK